MALDKQKILSELGSVMNKLQSADCGCMGKLFGNSNSHSPSVSTPNAVSGGCHHGCCHSHGYNRFNTPCGGEPTAAVNSHQMSQPCMGHCNPSKLYSDTYHYLNENLMQPTVKEVYNDLKSITPANTVMNNQLGNAMIASQGQTEMQLPQNNGGLTVPNQHNLNANSNIGGHMSGMGPNIYNMMMSGNKSNISELPGAGGSLTQPMVIDAPQSPHGKVGLMPVSTKFNTQESNDRQMHALNQHFNNNEGNLGNKMQIPNQNMLNNPNINSNTAVHQMEQKHKPYGQHSHGIAKFNEIFPGVMQNLGGDLGFDPMAIAVQMNPANQQRAAHDAMHKVMSNNNSGMDRLMNPPKLNQPPNMGTPTEEAHNPHSTMTPTNVRSNQIQQSVQNQEQINPYNQSLKTQQQVYTTLTPSLGHNHQLLQPQQSLQGQDHFMQATTPRNLISNNETLNQPPISESVATPISPALEKEPIFPANNPENQPFSHMERRTNYAYNTLGQPIEMLPAQIYHAKDPGGPQTLSPQNIPRNPKIFSNVKSTVSKTSIIGNRSVGRNLSKSHLQQYNYNQYKGSQSLTQQSILGPNEGVSYSEGKIQMPQRRLERMVPDNQIIVEKVGGDTLPGDESNQEAIKKSEQVTGRIGDVPKVNEITDNRTPEQMVTRNPKSRNGLQDMVYTSYPTSAAWSFHGHGDRQPLSVGARTKTRF